ncbi:MAG TPA: NAD(+)/NADH kinase [Pseudomonadales bacterium]|nr:NAD(+)/NADH kinase [Pseudomonadales bacterium]
MNHLGIIVNPMSGRDVRRVAARASTMSHHDKAQQVTRLVLGALESGVERIFLANEPFRINARAVENLPQRDQVTLLSFPLTHTSQDTATITNLMWDQGCRTFIVIGGDGTNRVVAATQPDAVILPVSTGTNNVFPFMVEGTVAGTAAGLVAAGRIDANTVCRPCKQVHLHHGNQSHVALVDAVLLKRDLLGSLLPFDPENIAAVVLAMSEPASIGMSPIGGYIMPCHRRDDFGVSVTMGEPARYRVRAPVSAGLYGDLDIADIRRVSLDEPLTLSGPGILAFDGDRIAKLGDQEPVTVTVRRDGPRVIDPFQVLETAAAEGILASGC